MIALSEVQIIGMAREGEPCLRPIGTFAIPAGFPSPADDHSEEIDIGKHINPNPDATFFLKVSGHSMIGAGIGPGDILAVDKSLTPQHGNIVIAVVNGEMTVKRLYNKGGVVKLRLENPKYKKITFSEDSELVIWGVVRNVVKDCV